MADSEPLKIDVQFYDDDCLENSGISHCLTEK